MCTGRPKKGRSFRDLHAAGDNCHKRREHFCVLSVDKMRPMRYIADAFKGAGERCFPMTSPSLVTKSIFDFNDYRQFLAHFFDQQKLKNSSYSHRRFAMQAGLSSPSHFLMIMRGSRNLSLKTISKFNDGLKLNLKERKYFETLVQYNQTTDLPSKAKLFGELMTLRCQNKSSTSLDREKFEFLSKWYCVAIYVLIDTYDFRADPKWLARRLGGRISSAQATEALNLLEKLGLIEKDNLRGFRQTPGSLTTADDTRSMAVYNYHESMVRLASEALRTLGLEEREFNGVTVAIPKNKVEEIKAKIRAFRKEINQLAGTFEKPDEVYHLNLQFFPLSCPVNKESL